MSVNPYIFTATVILIVIFWYMQHKKKQAAGPKGAPSRPAVERVVKVQEPPEVVYMNLRKKILSTARESLGLAGTPAEIRATEPYGLVMEMGMPKSAVTLACFANGDASVFYQTGGGMKGGGAHESVRKAAKEFTAMGEGVLSGMARAMGQPVPGPGKVRFYALTPKGLFTVETDREALGDPQDPLSALFYSGQEVVSEMREVQEQRRADFEGAASGPPSSPIAPMPAEPS